MTREYEIIPNVKYIHKNDHRDRTRNKSQWSISMNDERDCFKIMYLSNWYSDNKGWGLHIVDHIIRYLGYSTNNSRSLFIAKFVDGSGDNIWHGYPGDHIANHQDIPTSNILTDWISAGYISFSKVRKILKGQPCNI